MLKDARTTRASRFKRLAFGTFIVLIAGFIYFLLATGRSTSANLNIIGFATNQYGAFVTLQLTNSGPGTIKYLGYETADKPLPVYSLQFQSANGFTNEAGFLCGTGLQDCELKPYQSVDFQIGTSHITQNYRISLRYFTVDPLDWLRSHTPYQLSQRLPDPSAGEAHTPLIKANPELARVN